MPGKMKPIKVKKIGGVNVIPELKKMKNLYKEVEALEKHPEIKVLANQLKQNIIDLATIELDKKGINPGDIDAMKEVKINQKACEKKGEVLYKDLKSKMEELGLK